MRQAQKDVLSFVAAYVAALVTVVGLRLTPNVPGEVQFLLAGGAFTLVLLITMKVWPADSPAWLFNSGRRRGGRMIANAVVLFSAITLTSMTRGARPADWSVVVVGLGLPLFLAAQAAIDWRPNAVKSTSASVD